MKQNKQKIPVIIDTDIGDDIDDAFAICLAMQSTELEICCVTTVFKNTECRAKIARKLLDLGGFNSVPVYKGMAIPLVNRQVYGKDINYDEKPISYYAELDDIEISETCAVDAIIDVLDSSDNPITIVTMGALTNIADLFRRRPDLKNKISMISIMGGSYVKNMCEYNFTCDPEAANIVLNSGVKIIAVGVDITFECRLNKEQINRLNSMKNPVIKMLMRMRESWGGEVFLHDPLALACVFNPSFVDFKKALYHIEHGASLYSRGMCIPLSDHNWNMDCESSNLEVSVGVKAYEFCEVCMQRLEKFDTCI